MAAAFKGDRDLSTPAYGWDDGSGRGTAYVSTSLPTPACARNPEALRPRHRSCPSIASSTHLNRSVLLRA
jgi:hypothetical protein